MTIFKGISDRLALCRFLRTRVLRSTFAGKTQGMPKLIHQSTHRAWKIGMQSFIFLVFLSTVRHLEYSTPSLHYPGGPTNHKGNWWFLLKAMFWKKLQKETFDCFPNFKSSSKKKWPFLPKSSCCLIRYWTSIFFLTFSNFLSTVP